MNVELMRIRNHFNCLFLYRFDCTFSQRFIENYTYQLPVNVHDDVVCRRGEIGFISICLQNTNFINVWTQKRNSQPQN